MKTVEIYFEDLSTDVQEQLLKAFDVEHPKQMNWDTLPVTVITVEE